MALAWALPDEDSPSAQRFFRGLSAADRLLVPALWWSDVSNALLAAQRRRRLPEAEALRALELFGKLPVETDGASGLEAAWRWFALGREHGLSVYDACYLELAQRTGAGLASLDKTLTAAARKAGVRTF
jgi:predicted nucleic acid-binding protein